MPFKITFRLKGLAAIRQRLANRMSAFERIPVIMVEEVEMAVAMARAAASVRTGKMRDETRIGELDLENLRIVAGSYAMNAKGVYYPWFVEMGTVHMHARPFWRPPIWNAFFRIRERIRSEVMSGVKQ